MHDHSVCQTGTYDRAVAAIKNAKERGFRVNINCTLFNTAKADRVAAFFDTAMELGVDGITVSPGYAYERATDQGLASCMAVAVARPPLFRRLRSLSRTAAVPSRSPKKR